MTRSAHGFAVATLLIVFAVGACARPADTDWVPIGLISVTTTDRPTSEGDTDGATDAEPDASGEPLRVVGVGTFGRTSVELPAVDDVAGWTEGADACVVTDGGFGLPDPDGAPNELTDGLLGALPDFADAESYRQARVADGTDPVLLYRERAFDEAPDEREAYLTLPPDEATFIYSAERDDPAGMPADLFATAGGALWYPAFTEGPFPVVTAPAVVPSEGFGRDVRFAWTPDEGSGTDAVLLLLTIEATSSAVDADLACLVRDESGTFELPEETRAELDDDWQGELTFVRRDGLRIVEVGRGFDAGPLLLVGAQERSVASDGSEGAAGGDAP